MSQSWNKPRRPKYKQRGNYRQNLPPGLRGAEIGLYYKNLYAKKNKSKEKVINLKIPKHVLTDFDRNFKTIVRIAKDQNIQLKVNNKSNIKPNESVSNPNDKSMMDLENCDVKACNPSLSIKQEHSLSNIVLEDDMSNSKLCFNISNNYKYTYDDIITKSFDQKLDECLEKGVSINKTNCELQDLNIALYEEYKEMKQSSKYKEMLKFREILPAYIKSKDIINIIDSNQIVVISGETGCGKSTQVPQIILDDAICNGKGANVKIMVTQPRRIAASSLAMRVSKERGNSLGNSVGYAVRLENEPNPVSYVEELKERIVDAANKMRTTLTTGVVKTGLRRRMRQCIRNRGGHVEHEL